jgi:hypothetical protein
MGAVLAAGLTAKLTEAVQSGVQLTPERAAELVENPNALVEPVMRASLPANLLVPLENALVAALRSVFRLGAVLAALALLIVFFGMPRGQGIHKRNTPSPIARNQEPGARMKLSELTTIYAEHEPVSMSPPPRTQ